MMYCVKIWTNITKEGPEDQLFVDIHQGRGTWTGGAAEEQDILLHLCFALKEDIILVCAQGLDISDDTESVEENMPDPDTPRVTVDHNNLDWVRGDIDNWKKQDCMIVLARLFGASSNVINLFNYVAIVSCFSLFSSRAIFSTRLNLYARWSLHCAPLEP